MLPAGLHRRISSRSCDRLSRQYQDREARPWAPLADRSVRWVSTIAGVLTAFLFIVCEPGAIGRLGRALADTEGVAEVYTTTGSADFIAVVRVPDLDALATTVTQHIAELPPTPDHRA